VVACVSIVRFCFSFLFQRGILRNRRLRNRREHINGETCQWTATLCRTQGRIIHVAGEAEASGPGPKQRYNENLQSRTILGPEISREKICGLLNIFCLRGARALRGPQSLSCLRARRIHDPTMVVESSHCTQLTFK